MNNKDFKEEYGYLDLSLFSYCTHFHIKEIKEDLIILEDKCPKPKHKDIGNGDLLKLNIDVEDPDEVEFRKQCEKIVEVAIANKTCPEVFINLKISATINQLEK